MGISTLEKQLLLNSLHVVKPNFHCFSYTFQMHVKREPLDMLCLSNSKINEKTYILYCVLERIVMHLDNLRTVTPFIEHYAKNLSNMGMSHQDTDILCNSFLATLKIHLKGCYPPKLESIWQHAINIFKSIVTGYLFNTSNVLKLSDFMNKQQVNIES
ncbi:MULTISPECIES: globin [unclassified Pseudoalteromonas]|uniref:globin n=1 Tax=unclassified Pseudoalteromonas TaxID=194690 RepID=UPI000C07C075|nr:MULTISPECIES: globin [unclassified Pseudoalteromonas]MDB2355630.1 globin [Pseudoalteromonas sp.]MDP2635509.1 globin [Pseudoalteromonas sp. 1_MG-2023]PHN89105.1 globin [Pseudoalteromonas sp. 3D05]